MTIKEILDEIASEPGSNAKMDILRKYADNKLLEKVLYSAKSPRIKYYIKKLPLYKHASATGDLKLVIDEGLSRLSSRELTGIAGIDHLISLLSTSTPDDAYVIERIIEKDLKIGMGTSNINKVFPKLIEKTPYMGAKSFSEKGAKEILSNGIALSQVKMDGRYCNAIVEDGEVYLESRSGETTLITGAKILDELSKFNDCVLNGELTIPGISRNESNGIINSVISITTKLSKGENIDKDKENILKRHGLSYEDSLSKIVYTVWDIIEIEEYHDGKSETPYNQRLQSLIRNILEVECDKVEIIESQVVISYEQAMSHFVETLRRGLEGTILKSNTGEWKDSKPKWQIKMKLEIDIDMKIIGFNYGTPGTKNEHVISSLTVESSCGRVVTRPGGISELDMTYITNNQKDLMGSIVEMKCCGLSKDNEGNYSTLHPVFKILRDDKETADSLDQIISIEEMAKSLS